MSEIRAFLDPHHLQLRQRLAELKPEDDPEDDHAARQRAREWLPCLGPWVEYAVEPALGGRGPDLRACCLVREALAAISPLADDIFAVQCLGSMPLILGGSPELKARWLPRVLRGEAMAAFAMTEPEAGSDVAAMTTRAFREGDGYRLEGRKWLISNAGLADFYSVFAVTDPERGSRGISAFLVSADNPGLRFAGPQVLSSPHPLGELEFSGCLLAREALLGKEGEGFKLGMRSLDQLRPTVGAAACGLATRALQEALSYARKRFQFGQALVEFQLVQHSLAAMAMELAASRLLVFRAAWEKDQGAGRITQEAAMAKVYATEAAQRIVDAAVQIHGGRGLLKGAAVERLYRAVRALRVYEGASDILHLVIARGLLT